MDFRVTPAKFIDLLLPMMSILINSVYKIEDPMAKFCRWYTESPIARRLFSNDAATRPNPLFVNKQQPQTAVCAIARRSQIGKAPKEMQYLER